MEDKHEKLLESVKEQFIPKNFTKEQVDVVEMACKYIFNHIHRLISLLEWKVENNKLVCEAPFIGSFVICYSYEDNRFEVFYDGEFIDSRISMSAAKLVANDFYKSKICGILGLFPKGEQFKYELIRYKHKLQRIQS